MRLSPLILAIAALAGSASAQPIVILNAPVAPRAAPPSSDCAAGPADGADIECVLSLTPPRRNAEPAPPSRILIRAQWAPKSCPQRDVQVVAMSRTSARAARLPVVDQAGSGRACGS